MKPKVQNPAHQYGTTLPKRTKGIKRSALKNGSKPIPKVNVERLKQSAKRARAKHAKYMASETRRLVEERAEGMCEFSAPWGGPTPCGSYTETAFRSNVMRCTMTEQLEHHHVTYARYGGNELPEDVLLACKPHHDYLESLKPAGNRFSRSSRSRAGER